MVQGQGGGGMGQLSMSALPYEDARCALALSALSMPDRIAFMQVVAPGDPGTPSNLDRSMSSCRVLQGARAQ